MTFLDYLHAVADGHALSGAEAEQAMGLLLEGQASPAQVAGFLVALRMRGETGEEVSGFARAMRARVRRVDAGEGVVVDTCGTGGDGHGTFNVSTIAAFVAAGAGARVAKHGNRSISSRCGSADILEALGVKIALEPEQMGACIREVGIGFLFAPALHPAMKHAQPVRVDLKMRTVFNMLGPLTNPAGASAQVVGAWSERAAELMAEALARLGLERGFVVHGSDGMDEITTTGETLALEVRGGKVLRHRLGPEDFGVARASLKQLQGGDRDENAGIARAVLGGEKGARRDIVLVNAAAALVAAGRAGSFGEGMRMAAESVDSGAAAEKMTRLVEFSRSISTQTE
jgi:anthranilate phosphoribosyltransferase